MLTKTYSIAMTLSPRECHALLKEVVQLGQKDPIRRALIIKGPSDVKTRHYEKSPIPLETVFLDGSGRKLTLPLPRHIRPEDLMDLLPLYYEIGQGLAQEAEVTYVEQDNLPAFCEEKPPLGLIPALHENIQRRVAGDLTPPLEGALLQEWQWEIPWEVQRIKDIIQKEIFPRLKKDQHPELTLYVSEPKSIREQLANWVAEHTPQPTGIKVYSSYKQAFYWLTEEVLPLLQQDKPKSLILIIPKAPQGIELPIVHVQSMYPADRILAEQLGLAIDDIQLILSEQEDYELKWSTETELKTVNFRPRYTTRMYLPNETKEVHPETAYIELKAGDQLLFSQEIASDVQFFWDRYLTEVLPILQEKRQWQLTIDVSLSETDEEIGYLQERISPLEELHEDLYFVTLNALATVGEKAPGAILPSIQQRLGQDGKAWIRLHEPRQRIQPNSVMVSFIRYSREHILYGTINTDLSIEMIKNRLHALITPVDMSLSLNNQETLYIPKNMPEPAELPPATLGPDELLPQLGRLNVMPNIRYQEVGSSFGGRPMYALYTLPGGQDFLPKKAASILPTALVIAGHHANEVSSQHSVLQLIEYWSQTDKPLLLAAIPMENPDGFQLQKEMAKEHPHWKLHAARFNALGYEFGQDYRKEDTPFGEAKVRPRLVRDLNPALILDNHGVPSHEWYEPMAGRSSPPYFPLSYWLPSGLFYGIAHSDDPFIHQAWQNTSARFFADPELASYQAELWQNYLRYGKNFLPKSFPSEVNPHLLPMQMMNLKRPTLGRQFVTEVADETATGDYLLFCAKTHLLADIAFLETLILETKET